MHFYTFFPKEYDDMQSDFFDDAIVIMIDVLRASTTICASFFNGTKEVIPFVSPKEAYNYYLNREDKENYILSGEINLELPKGFMLGNSPNENKKDIVQNKSIILTTSNGTKIFKTATSALYRIIGSFVNIDAVVSFIIKNVEKKYIKKIVLLCAGEKGLLCLEDILCAGMFIYKLVPNYNNNSFSDTAKLAVDFFNFNKNNFNDILENAQHSKELYNLGFENDILFAGTLNKCPVIPFVNKHNIISL